MLRATSPAAPVDPAAIGDLAIALRGNRLGLLAALSRDLGSGTGDPRLDRLAERLADAADAGDPVRCVSCLVDLAGEADRRAA